MKIRFLFLISFLLTILFFSCEKPEGVGGNSIITGNVTIQVYDKEFKVLQEEYPADDEEVFIIYGDNDYYSDKVNTSYNGIFQFENLNKGDYTVFVYSEDNSGSLLHDIQMDTTFNISSKKEEIKDVNFTIYKTLDYDDGKASISGNVSQVIWTKDFGLSIDTLKAAEVDVYLLYEDNESYIERVKTLDGSYEFPNVIKGSYVVKVYSEWIPENPSVKSDNKIFSKPITISVINQNAMVEDIYIHKEN